MIGMGIGQETLVGICLPRSAEWVVAMLAVLKAGGAFVAMNPADPAKRLKSIIETSGARLAICQAEGALRLAQSSTHVINLDDDHHKIDAMPDTRPSSAVGGENLAYVIFTYGSTGVPKGVEVEHRSLLNLIHWHIK